MTDQPYGSHQLLGYKGGAPLIIAKTSGLTSPGYTLIVDEAAAADIYAILVTKVRRGGGGWRQMDHHWGVRLS